jgi:hypothetical protein
MGARLKNPVVAVVAVIVAMISLRFAIVGIERWIIQDPQRWPPAWQIARQARQIAQPTIADDVVGFVLPGNLDLRVVTDDFTFSRRTDAHGFPNAGPWPDRADIVVLGDSLLLGEGVGVENSFVARIDALLGDEAVLNLGNPGAGAERQYRIYRRFGRPLQPRLVVASLYLASDLEGDKHFQAWLAKPLGMDYDTFRLSYRRRTEPPPSGISKRFDRHPLYVWARSIVEPRLWGSLRIPHRIKVAKAEYFLDRRMIEFARRPATGVVDELEGLFSSLGRLRALVEAEGEASLAVMLIPSKEELFAAPPGDDGVLAAVRAQLESEDIPYFDLYPILRAREVEAATYFPRDIHLSRFGNEVVAEAFVEWQSALPAGHRQ